MTSTPSWQYSGETYPSLTKVSQFNLRSVFRVLRRVRLQPIFRIFNATPLGNYATRPSRPSVFFLLLLSCNLIAINGQCFCALKQYTYIRLYSVCTVFVFTVYSVRLYITCNCNRSTLKIVSTRLERFKSLVETLILAVLKSIVTYLLRKYLDKIKLLEFLKLLW